jgi:type II secretory pathway pseudopilin PulG
MWNRGEQPVRRSRPLRGDDGFAVPTVLFMLLAAFAVASVAAVASMSSQRGVVRDQDTKEALTAAEAGVSQALLHYNRVPTSGANKCVVSNGGTLFVAPPVGGWCQQVQGTSGSGTFAYTVAPTDGEIEIVSVGNANGVTRRIDVVAESGGGQQIFSDSTVKSQDSLTLDSNAEIRANAATNGDIILSSNAKLCGQGSVGVGRHLDLTSNAQYNQHFDCTVPLTEDDVIQQPLVLPPVNQGDAPDNNDNDRFFSQDPRSGKGVTWDPVTRTLVMKSNSELSLGGSVYSFCKLEMSSNTTINVAPGSEVKIYFDSPEACLLPSGTTQISLSSNSKVTTTGGGPTNAAFLVVGSATRVTRIQLNSNTQVDEACEQNFVIYAPRSDVDFDSNSRYCGAIAAKSIHMDSNSQVFTDSGASQFELPPAAPHYVIGQFVECDSAPATTPPDAEC